MKAAATIAKYRQQILLAITERVTNARVEALNTTMRLLTRRAYGFHTARPLIALAMLKLGGPHTTTADHRMTHANDRRRGKPAAHEPSRTDGRRPGPERRPAARRDPPGGDGQGRVGRGRV